MEPFVFVPKTGQEVANFAHAIARTPLQRTARQENILFLKRERRPGKCEIDKLPTTHNVQLQPGFPCHGLHFHLLLIFTIYGAGRFIGWLKQ